MASASGKRKMTIRGRPRPGAGNCTRATRAEGRMAGAVLPMDDRRNLPPHPRRLSLEGARGERRTRLLLLDHLINGSAAGGQRERCTLLRRDEGGGIAHGDEWWILLFS